MENTIYLGLSRQMTLMQDMQVISNNIANANTPGYRGQNLVFEEYLEKIRGNNGKLSFAYDRGQYQMTSPGPVNPTENPLDIALGGPGFIGVQTRTGEQLYTRAGNFAVNIDGTLMTQAGQAVVDAGGAAITVPRESREIKIDERGFISNQDGPVGQIMIVEFDDVQSLEAVGENTYRATAATLPAENTRVKQGYLEGSNIQPVLEIARMIDTSRTFQTLHQTLQSEHERLRGAIRTLTGSGNS